MKGVFIVWIVSILLFAGCAYIINTDDSGEYVKMDGTILGKAVLRGYGKRAPDEPTFGVTFDDGIERDVGVTLASYSRFNVGDRVRLSVRTEMSTKKNYACSGVVASVFLIFITTGLMSADRYQFE